MPLCLSMVSALGVHPTVYPSFHCHPRSLTPARAAKDACPGSCPVTSSGSPPRTRSVGIKLFGVCPRLRVSVVSRWGAHDVPVPSGDRNWPSAGSS